MSLKPTSFWTGLPVESVIVLNAGVNWCPVDRRRHLERRRRAVAEVRQHVVALDVRDRADVHRRGFADPVRAAGEPAVAVAHGFLDAGALRVVRAASTPRGPLSSPGQELAHRGLDLRRRADVIPDPDVVQGARERRAEHERSDRRPATARPRACPRTPAARPCTRARRRPPSSGRSRRDARRRRSRRPPWLLRRRSRSPRGWRDRSPRTRSAPSASSMPRAASPAAPEACPRYQNSAVNASPNRLRRSRSSFRPNRRTAAPGSGRDRARPARRSRRRRPGSRCVR